MKRRVVFVVVDVYEISKGIWRWAIEVARACPDSGYTRRMYSTPSKSSLRRAQRAQLAIIGGVCVNSLGANADTLAALENLVAKYDAMQDGNIGAQLTNGDFFAARAAIAKAKGQAA